MWQPGVKNSVLKHETPFKNYATRLARKEGMKGRGLFADLHESLN
jgi:hypothetical protein